MYLLIEIYTLFTEQNDTNIKGNISIFLLFGTKVSISHRHRL